MSKKFNENRELIYHNTEIVIRNNNGLVECIEGFLATPYIINFPYQYFKDICKEFLRIENTENHGHDDFLILFPPTLDVVLLKALLKKAQLICNNSVYNFFIECKTYDDYNELMLETYKAVRNLFKELMLYVEVL